MCGFAVSTFRLPSFVSPPFATQVNNEYNLTRLLNSISNWNSLPRTLNTQPTNWVSFPFLAHFLSLLSAHKPSPMLNSQFTFVCFPYNGTNSLSLFLPLIQIPKLMLPLRKLVIWFGQKFSSRAFGRKEEGAHALRHTHTHNENNWLKLLLLLFWPTASLGSCQWIDYFTNHTKRVNITTRTNEWDRSV